MENKISYKIVNGVSYHVETTKEVIDILEDVRKNKKRIRIFLGDSITGRDWAEEYGTIGTIGKSTGNIQIPLLIKRAGDVGGAGILDHCIVKITKNKEVIYEHPSYHIGNIELKEANSEQKKLGYLWDVIIDEKTHGSFKDKQSAENYIAFLKGERNKI